MPEHPPAAMAADEELAFSVLQERYEDDEDDAADVTCTSPRALAARSAAAGAPIPDAHQEVPLLAADDEAGGYDEDEEFSDDSDDEYGEVLDWADTRDGAPTYVVSVAAVPFACTLSSVIVCNCIGYPVSHQLYPGTHVPTGWGRRCAHSAECTFSILHSRRAAQLSETLMHALCSRRPCIQGQHRHRLLRGRAPEVQQRRSGGQQGGRPAAQGQQHAGKPSTRHQLCCTACTGDVCRRRDSCMTPPYGAHLGTGRPSARRQRCAQSAHEDVDWGAAGKFVHKLDRRKLTWG
jgi:hypothetical protein